MQNFIITLLTHSLSDAYTLYIIQGPEDVITSWTWQIGNFCFCIMFFWQFSCSMFSWKIWYKFISCQEHFRNNRGDCGSLSALDVCGYLSFQRNPVVEKYPNSFLRNQLDFCTFFVAYWFRRSEICVYLASKRDPHETAAPEKYLLYFFDIFD